MPLITWIYISLRKKIFLKKILRKDSNRRLLLGVFFLLLNDFLSLLFLLPFTFTILHKNIIKKYNVYLPTNISHIIPDNLY